MKEQLHHLNELVECLPCATSSRGVSDLNILLSKYTKILNLVNSYNEKYKRATFLYYNNINNIKDYIELSVYTESHKEKNTAFESARGELKKDIQALSTLIKPQQELVELAV